MHILEPHDASAHDEGLGAGLVLDFGMLVQKLEHGLDVDDRLLHLAIEHAHEIQGLIELDHHGVDEHEIADGVGAVANPRNAHHHDDGQADGENDPLPGVQHRQRDIAVDGELLVASHGLVVALGLPVLGAEIFHGLVVQQTIDGLGVGVRVALVHGAADRHAPVGRRGGEPEITDDHDGGDGGIAPVELVEHHTQDQGELHDGGNAREHAQTHDLLDGGASALQHARQAAGLALQMEAQRQAMQMDEDLVRQAPHGVHGDSCEERVAALREELHEGA